MRLCAFIVALQLVVKHSFLESQLSLQCSSTILNSQLYAAVRDDMFSLRSFSFSSSNYPPSLPSLTLDYPDMFWVNNVFKIIFSFTMELGKAN